MAQKSNRERATFKQTMTAEHLQLPVKPSQKRMMSNYELSGSGRSHRPERVNRGHWQREELAIPSLQIELSALRLPLQHPPKLAHPA